MNQKRTQSRITPTAVIAAVIMTLLAVPASAVLAGTETYSIDGSHSSVGFSIVHFFSKVPGRFTKVEGTFEIDVEDLSQGMVTITIDATSIDTDNDDRDKHLRSEDFFDVARHPKITFVSTKLMADGKNKTRVEGTLTLRGVSKPVILEVEFLGAGPDAWGGFRSGIEARTTINRKDFGIIWNKALDTGGWVLGEEVEILLNIEGIRQAAAPEEAAG